MSKQRRTARAEREAAEAARTAAKREQRQRAAAERARRERRSLWWRRLRLWQHGPTFRRRRETYGAMATLVLLVLLAVFVLTRSLADVLGTALIFIVGTPVLFLLFFDRSRK